MDYSESPDPLCLLAIRPIFRLDSVFFSGYTRPIKRQVVIKKRDKGAVTLVLVWETD